MDSFEPIQGTNTLDETKVKDLRSRLRSLGYIK